MSSWPRSALDRGKGRTVGQGGVVERGRVCWNLLRNVEGKHVAEVGQANRKDVRNAVEVATKAQPGWEKRSAFNRAQILFYIGNLNDIYIF